MKNKGHEWNLRPPGHAKSVGNRGGTGGVSFDLAALGAKKLGEGAYGAAYGLRVTAAAADFFARLLVDGRHRVKRKIPRAFASVVVKVAKGQGDPARFVDDSVREAGVHKYLSTACSKVCKKVCAPVPEFYFSAMGSDGTYYTVMGVADGGPLANAIRAGLTAELYVRVERATVSLWLSGVLHADFHAENAFVGPDGTVTVIDFGFAVLMPPALRKKVEAAVARHVRAGSRTLAEAWDETGLTGFADRVHHARDSRVEWYNPDNKALKDLYNRLSPADAARVPDLRRAAWGCARSSRSPKTPKTPKTPATQSVKRSRARSATRRR